MGHSTPEYALDICSGIGVRWLVLYHHAPSHGDDLMDQIAQTYRQQGKALGTDVVTTHEHLKLHIGPQGSCR